MAFRFDDILEHRETIVARVPRSWRLPGWFIDATVYALPIGGAVAVGLIGPDTASLAALGAALAGLLVYSIHHYAWSWSHEAVVTDKRLLYRAGWRKPALTEIRIEEVARVEVAEDRVRITRHDGTELHLNHPRGGPSLAEALAREARVAPPRPAPQTAAVADYIFTLSAMVGGIAAAVVPLKLVYPHLADWAATVGWLVSGGGFLLFGWLAHLIGFTFAGYVVAIFLLRPLLSFEQTAAWIAHSPVFWPPPDTPQAPEDTLSHRLARLLHGRPAPPPAGGTGHG